MPLFFWITSLEVDEHDFSKSALSLLIIASLCFLFIYYFIRVTYVFVNVILIQMLPQWL